MVKIITVILLSIMFMFAYAEEANLQTEDLMKMMLNIEIGGTEPIMSFNTQLDRLLTNPDGLDVFVGDPDGVGNILIVKLIDNPKDDTQMQWLSVEYKGEAPSMNTTTALESLIGDGALIEILDPDGGGQTMRVWLTETDN